MTSDVVHKGEANDNFGARKLGLSCAECRRSKLKCDRIFPCQSCIRRGCSGICPDGTLAATKGNKVLMAQAQRLSEQVKSLNSRVRELEAALVQTRSGEEKNNSQTNLDVDVFHDEGIKSVSEAIGSLSLGIDGQARYHGESAGSEYLQDLLPKDETPLSQRIQPDLPNEILILMGSFPFGFKDCPYNKSIFIRYLPSRQRAVELACIYYRSVAWMYDPISSDDFSTSILDPIYGTDSYPSTDALHSHRLAVFFMVLANGNLYDSHPSATSVAEHYYALARAALCLDSVLLEVTCATVQALFLVFRFIYNASQANKEERWLLTGLATRVAQTIGLQRDSAGWNLEPEEVQRRRRLFWELFTWENWSSLVHGRPGSLFVQHTDCKFPEDLEPFIDLSGKREIGFHAWKFRYSAECLSISVEHVFSIRTPPYSALLSIDQKIRNFAIPKHLRCPEGNSNPEYSWSNDSARALQQYCALCVRDSNLLYIHRSYFAQAIREAPDDPFRHRYKPSVLATYRASCRLISTLKSLYPVCPLASSVWFFWSGIFSSCVVLGALVVESPGCTLARDAMSELQTALPFFEQGSRQCRPSSVWTFLQKLHKRASTSYTSFQTGLNTDIHNSGSTNEPDELEVLGGRKSVITTRSNPNSPAHVTPGSPSTLNQDTAPGSSPISQPAVAEMPEYYQSMDASASPIQKSQLDDSILRFEDHTFSLGKVTHHVMSAEQAATISTTYMTDSTPVPVTTDSIRHHNATTNMTNAWHTLYSLPQHPAYSHQISANFLPYEPAPPAHPSHSGATPYGYQQRLIQEQNQVDVWGNYMMGFGS